jgi:hypothetical protein
VHPAEIIACIESAFDGAPRAETSLRQFLLTDGDGMSGDISGRQWEASGRQRVDSIWQEIPDMEIEAGAGLLAHMDAGEFRYYLPAYMRYAVAHRASWESDVLGMTVSSLCPSEKNLARRAYAIAQYAALDAAQREAVVRFLAFVAQLDDGMHAHTVHGALVAMASYWLADAA